EARNEQEEITFITNFLKNYGENNLSDVAVLYRTNAQSRVIEEILLHHGIPYTLIGGTRFYERREVKDVLSYLRVFVNPKDSVSRKRVEKLGKTRFAKFQAFVENTKGVSEGEELQTPNQDTLPTLDLLDSIMHATGYL